MSRVLLIGNHAQVSRQIGDALSAANFPMEYAAGHADALQRLRMRSFGVVITNPDSAVDEDLALLEEMRAIRPGVKCIVLGRGADEPQVIDWVKIGASVDGFDGFAVGRTLWGGPAMLWLEGTLDDERLIDRVAQAFERLVEAWRRR